jgi:hypothetical protein
MSLYYKKLKFDSNFLIDESLVTAVNTLTKFRPEEIVNKDILDTIKSMGIQAPMVLVLPYLKVSWALFRRSPIHLDDAGVHDQTNLNYMIDRGNAYNNWYAPIGDYQGYTSTNGIAKTSLYDQRQMSLVESVHLSESCLFQAGIPHSVSNIDQDRWCVSVKLRHPGANTVAWHDAIRLFADFYADTNITVPPIYN